MDGKVTVGLQDFHPSTGVSAGGSGTGREDVTWNRCGKGRMFRDGTAGREVVVMVVGYNMVVPYRTIVPLWYTMVPGTVQGGGVLRAALWFLTQTRTGQFYYTDTYRTVITQIRTE